MTPFNNDIAGKTITEEIDNCSVTTIYETYSVRYIVIGSEQFRARYVNRVLKDYGKEGYGVKPKIKRNDNSKNTTIIERRNFGTFSTRFPLNLIL